MKLRFSIIIGLLVVVALLVLISGASNISASQSLKAIFSDAGIATKIIWHLRIPKIITAFLAGAALSICGLMMQTYFRNPLAGPFVLGISSGATLGVALWILASSFIPLFLYHLGLTTSAIIGAISVLFLLLFCARKFEGNIALLVMGLVFGYFTSGLINLLIVISNAHKIKSFLIWTLGSFSRVGMNELPYFCGLLIVVMISTFAFVKPLNAFLLGTDYAKSLGINIKRIRFYLFLITAILTGAVTSYCGPIAFIGIIVPHMGRYLFKSSDHRILLPATMLLGGLVALLAELCVTLLTSVSLPINAVMGLFGAPLIILFVWNTRLRGES